MRKSILFTILIAATTLLLWSCESDREIANRVYGYVTFADGQPAKSINVELRGLGNAVTDNVGFYVINYTITIPSDYSNHPIFFELQFGNYWRNTVTVNINGNRPIRTDFVIQ